ncbi:MAG: anaerobic ribonucleoside-triphosphate reductase [Bacteroidales bacterium]
MRRKDGVIQNFNGDKIKVAISKSARRAGVKLSNDDKILVVNLVLEELKKRDVSKVDVFDLHMIVETCLDQISPKVAKSYRDYRNYKMDVGRTEDKIKSQIDGILSGTNKENSNCDMKYISTQRTEISQTFCKEYFQSMHLSAEEIRAISNGYFYIHDLKDMMLPMYNCCLARIGTILEGGYELDGFYYPEPKDIKRAVSRASDLILNISAQQYGGLTVPQVDKIFAKYYRKTYDSYVKKMKRYGVPYDMVPKYAKEEAFNDLKQSFQGFEAALKQLSARGSFPFVTFTFGDCTDKWEADVSKAILEVRMEGHGEPGKKKSMIFPKLVFLHNYDVHGDGKEFEWLFDLSVSCSSKCMYPDYIGDGHKREGKWVSPMGCRAYLSNWRNSENELIFEGRINLGAISLNMPMIFEEAQDLDVGFFERLEYYLQMIRRLHIRRFEYVGKAKASSNPCMFMLGGAYGGFLGANDEIAPLLKSATISFGVTALNELTWLATGHSLADGNQYASKVLDFINEKIEKYKEEDGILYAMYGTPAESLCGTQVQQFRKVYGEVENVSVREYFTNSFHCHVSEEITPFEKQDIENELFKKCTGGHIQYVRIPNPKNISALKAVILRGINMGFYQGINFNATSCEDCGHEEPEMGGKCTKCGSTNITEFNRNCGYLGYSRIKGDHTFNAAKMAEIEDRNSM